MVISISPIFAIIIITAVPYILHLTIPIIRASRAVTITPIIIALPAVVLTRSIVPTAATRRGRGSPTAEGALTASSRRSRSTITTRIKSPRCRRRGTRPLNQLSARCMEYRSQGHSYLNLQHIVSPKTLVMHLMICIIGITTALILHKGKAIFSLINTAPSRYLGCQQSANSQSTCRTSWSRNITTHKASIA